MNNDKIEKMRMEFDKRAERNLNCLSSPAIVREALALERMLYRMMDNK